MTTRRTLTVGTRGSALALTQTNSVVAMLRALHPRLDIRIRRITTKGDVMRDVPLATLGGRGVFVDAIEEALRQREIDLAVHSAKDLPSREPPDLTIGAFLERVDPRDVLISRAGTLHELPVSARVGTSSLRRVSQVHAVRPDLDTRDLRGNVDTRLRKLDAGDYDAIVLAAAGLLRLGLAGRITEWLSAESMLPSPGQGALAVEVRADDTELRELAGPLAHAPTEAALVAERAFLARLGAGCAAAVGAYATLADGDRLTLRAMIGTADGRSVRWRETSDRAGATALGERVADSLLATGGRELAAESERRSLV
jgi:hydroxymethylbilane synthase